MISHKGMIFGGNSVRKTSAIRYENTDIDIPETLMEMLVSIEDRYFSITESLVIANHIGIKDENIEILTEGFGDFINGVVEFFKTLLEKFKKFMGNVFAYISSFLRGFDKFLVTYKDRIDELDPDFSISGYSYSFESSIPRMDSIQSLISSYNSDVSNIHTRDKGELLKEKEENTGDEYFNRLRASVIGESGQIDFEDFANSCKKVYRSGNDTTEEIHVNKSYLTSIVHDYPKLKQVYKDCQRDKDKVILLIESIKNFFSKQAHVHPRNGAKAIYVNQIEINDNKNGIRQGDKSEIAYSTQSMEKVNIFFNYKWEQSKEIGAIVITSITEKVNALKEAMKQTETIVRRALFNGKKEEGVKNND